MIGVLIEGKQTVTQASGDLSHVKQSCLFVRLFILEPIMFTWHYIKTGNVSDSKQELVKRFTFTNYFNFVCVFCFFFNFLNHFKTHW